MELTFLVGKDGRNVKRTRQACARCRQRKKRCFHESPAPSDQPSLPELQAPVERSADEDAATSDDRAGRNSSTSRQIHEHQASNSPEESNTPGDTRSELDTSRFLCYTSPLVALHNDSQTPQPRRLRDPPRKGDVGAWSHGDSISSRPTELHRPPTSRQQRDTGTLPPKQSQIALLEIFFTRIHPFLPIVNRDDTYDQFKNGTLSLPLLQAICLVAAKDRSAASFLLLGSDATLLPVERFGQRLYNEILQSVSSRRDENRLLVIRILTLLSLHEWGPHGSEDSSLNLAKAIHHAWSIGLHLRLPDSQISLKAKALFWCLWSLDKWNSVVDGRPVLIHDYDHGQKVTDVLHLFQPPFQLWLLIADQLGRVISTYRPRLEGDQDQIPDLALFEELVETSQAWDTEPQLLDSLELYYHATVILGTYSAELQGRQPSRLSTIHQSQAILALASMCRRRDTRDFSPLPVSSYAISLAFSITYRQLQRSKLISHRLIARENLLIFNQSLRSICNIWWLAAVMVRLGKHALESSQLPATQENSEPRIDTIPLPEDPSSGLPLNQHVFPNANGSTLQSDDPQSNLNTSDGIGSEPSFSSDLDRFFENQDLSSLGEESFQTFFENFLDVNLPTNLGDQSFGGYDALI